MIMPNAKGQAKTCTSSSHQDARTALAFIRHAQLSVSSIGRKTLGDELVSSIGRGLCVLIGVSRDDTPKDMEYIVRKILNLRVFDDDQEKRWAHSVKDKNYEILCVSQMVGLVPTCRSVYRTTGQSLYNWSHLYNNKRVSQRRPRLHDNRNGRRNQEPVTQPRSQLMPKWSK
ncbi:uncharacterized protein LOC144911935 isoform X4 [Branchiostoma floridae x Branchiostoma belcheri]